MIIPYIQLNYVKTMIKLNCKGKRFHCENIGRKSIKINIISYYRTRK